MNKPYIIVHMMTSIDGRGDQTAVFDGMQKGSTPISLQLKDVKKYDDGALWLRYTL